MVYLEHNKELANHVLRLWELIKLHLLKKLKEKFSTLLILHQHTPQVMRDTK